MARARDKEVLAVQNKLKELGLYTGVLDGDFGPATLASVLKGLDHLKASVMAQSPAAAAQTKAIAIALSSWMEGLVAILEEFEAFRSKAYWDATGQLWTIGIGTTIYPDGSRVKKGDTCTRAQAVGYVEHDVLTVRKPAVEKMITKRLNDNELAALVSFVYNVGTGDPKQRAAGGFYWSKLRTNINLGVRDQKTITSNFQAYERSGGKVLEGLRRRRLAEARLYFTPVTPPQTVSIFEGDKPETGAKPDEPVPLT